MEDIQELFLSRKWKIIPALEQMTLDELNQAIAEAWVRLEPNNADHREFLHLTLFLKAQVFYDPKDILRDMFFSGNWTPHKSILRLSFAEINSLHLSLMMSLFEEKIIFDENQLSNLALFLKSHIVEKVEDKKAEEYVPSLCNIA